MIIATRPTILISFDHQGDAALLRLANRCKSSEREKKYNGFFILLEGSNRHDLPELVSEYHFLRTYDANLIPEIIRCILELLSTSQVYQQKDFYSDGIQIIGVGDAKLPAKRNNQDESFKLSSIQLFQDFIIKFERYYQNQELASIIDPIELDLYPQISKIKSLLNDVNKNIAYSYVMLSNSERDAYECWYSSVEQDHIKPIHEKLERSTRMFESRLGIDVKILKQVNYMRGFAISTDRYAGLSNELQLTDEASVFIKYLLFEVTSQVEQNKFPSISHLSRFLIWMIEDGREFAKLYYALGYAKDLIKRYLLFKKFQTEQDEQLNKDQQYVDDVHIFFQTWYARRQIEDLNPQNEISYHASIQIYQDQVLQLQTQIENIIDRACQGGPYNAPQLNTSAYTLGNYDWTENLKYTLIRLIQTEIKNKGKLLADKVLLSLMHYPNHWAEDLRHLHAKHHYLGAILFLEKIKTRQTKITGIRSKVQRNQSNYMIRGNDENNRDYLRDQDIKDFEKINEELRLLQEYHPKPISQHWVFLVTIFVAYVFHFVLRIMGDSVEYPPQPTTSSEYFAYFSFMLMYLLINQLPIVTSVGLSMLFGFLFLKLQKKKTEENLCEYLGSLGVIRQKIADAVYQSPIVVQEIKDFENTIEQWLNMQSDQYQRSFSAYIEKVEASKQCIQYLQKNLEKRSAMKISSEDWTLIDPYQKIIEQNQTMSAGISVAARKLVPPITEYQDNDQKSKDQASIESPWAKEDAPRIYDFEGNQDLFLWVERFLLEKCSTFYPEEEGNVPKLEDFLPPHFVGQDQYDGKHYVVLGNDIHTTLREIFKNKSGTIDRLFNHRDVETARESQSLYMIKSFEKNKEWQKNVK